MFEGTRKTLPLLLLLLTPIPRPAPCRAILTARIGIKAKVENKGQYQQYLDELKPLREELGITLKEDLYPEAADKIVN